MYRYFSNSFVTYQPNYIHKLNTYTLFTDQGFIPKQNQLNSKVGRLNSC